MNNPLTRLALCAAMLTAAGCTDIYEPTPKITKIESAWMISDTASLSSTLVRTPKSDIVTCSEPQPDAAFNQGESADVNVSLISVGGGSDSSNDGQSESSEETELAGRTPAVLMSRELFFRACEFSQNYKLSKDEALDLYNKTLEIVDKNWAVEAGQTTVTIGDTITTTQGATVSSTVSQTQSQTGTSSNTTSEAGSGTATESTSEDSE